MGSWEYFLSVSPPVFISAIAGLEEAKNPAGKKSSA
jgi:hypothetical protein